MTPPGSMPEPSGAVPAVVLGQHLTALGAIRPLAARGVPTYLVAPEDDVARRSRFTRGGSTSIEPGDLDALTAFLERTLPGGAVLVPCSDDWVRTVAAKRDERRYLAVGAIRRRRGAADRQGSTRRRAARTRCATSADDRHRRSCGSRRDGRRGAAVVLLEAPGTRRRSTDASA